MPIRPVHNEMELLQAVGKGNEKAFERLFYAYHNQLGEYVLQLIGSEELAQEIVQDVFVKIWMSRETLDTVKSFSSWLFILTRNYTLNCIRKEAGNRKKQDAFQLYVAGDLDGNEGPAIPADYEQVVDRAVAQLPPQQQKVFTLKKAGRKNDEIAYEMGISPESVKKYQQWALKSVSDFVKTHAEFNMVLLAIALLKK